MLRMMNVPGQVRRCFERTIANDAAPATCFTREREAYYKPPMPVDRPTREPQPTVAELWLRRADRGTVGGLAILAVVLMSAYWFYQGGHRRWLIDVDRAERQQAAFLVDLNQADWPELAALPGV